MQIVRTYIESEIFRISLCSRELFETLSVNITTIPNKVKCSFNRFDSNGNPAPLFRKMNTTFSLLRLYCENTAFAHS